MLAGCRDPSSAPAQGVASGGRPPSFAGAAAQSVGLEQLCSSLGALERIEPSRWLHGGPKLRATVPGSGGNYAALRFRLLGSSHELAPLGSGELREQIGLKLRARDSCNVAYVMWRFTEPPSVVASWKSNPAARHAECGNRGYRTLRATWSRPVEVAEKGSTHELSARIDGDQLHVWIDAQPVLRAALEPGMLDGAGEVGLRSDNLSFELLGFDAVMTERGRRAREQGRCSPGAAPSE